MESNEFDSTLGGSERLPHAANSLKFAVSRSIEIAAMTESILRPSRTKLIFQTLPVHMRRRVMSHNCKRLPRKLRNGHFEQLKKSGLPPKQKRPSRKYRRRPANLLAEYERRKKNHKWLESHIWHAKRFHMVERWGYRLALAPCDKSFRACYRATSAHCLIQDISYLEVLQIVAHIKNIESAFKMLTRPGEGLGVCAKAYSSGGREGSAHFYRPNGTGYIGKVDFLWKPFNTNEERRTLWLFIHPSHSDELCSACLEAFSASSDHYVIPEKKQKLSEGDSIMIETKITKLQNKLNRFRLTGPKAQAVIARALKLSSDENISKDVWLKTIGGYEKLKLKEKNEYWESIKGVSSPGELPARLVFGAIVCDPRLIRPQKRTKAQPEVYNPVAAHALVTIPPHMAESPLWNQVIHKQIEEKRWSDGQLIEYATKHQLVPGEVHSNNPDVQNVPVILIQRPGSQSPHGKKLGYGCGWDIIIPPGYSLAFWRSFILLGARAGGLRETQSVARETGVCHIAPDSASGHIEELRICKEMKDKYFRLPPNKRVNFLKLGINSPFLCLWDVLMKDYTGSNAVNVLRNIDILKKLQNAIEKKIVIEPDDFASYLIPIALKITGKGSLKPHAIICLPNDNDLKSKDILTEPCHTDPNEKQRNATRKAHRTKLKQLRRQRIKLKKKGKVINRLILSKNEPSEYTLRMRELWLPTQVESVRTSCSRQVMGYLSDAGFTFTEAGSCGVGYIVGQALSEMLKRGFNTVLVRNTQSRIYRIANISVIVNT